MAKRGREKFAVIKPVLMVFSKIYKLFPVKIRKWLLLHYRSRKGLLGIGLRYALLASLAERCGNNVSVHEDCYIFWPQKLSIGSNVSIHPMCNINASGEIEIGNDVSIAHNVTIVSTSHQYDRHDIPIKDQDLVYAKTTICDNVWIGAKAVILCGVTVGSGAVIGAGAVVTHDVPPNTVVAGVPAVPIKER